LSGTEWRDRSNTPASITNLPTAKCTPLRRCHPVRSSAPFADRSRRTTLPPFFCLPFPQKKMKAHRSLDTPSLHISNSNYAAPIDLLAWKHSRQNTGRPCVGRNGTVVSLPHCEQFVFVSARIGVAPPPPPPPSARLALQPLHRFGSFLNPLSAKNICSPAVNTNSAPHSEHFNTRSWNSMSAPPGTHIRQGDGPILHHEPWTIDRPVVRECRARIPGACVRRKVQLPNVSA
jgi:hypothetical protein